MAVPVAAVVLLLGLGVVSAADPSYQASGSVVVLRYDPSAVDPPVFEPTNPSRNPYGEFNASVSITAQLMADVANSDAFRRQVAEDGGSADLTVEKQEDAPILEIEATADSAAEAVETVSLIIAELDAELSQRQDDLNVPDDDQLVIQAVEVPERASQLDTDRNRAVTVVIAVGLAAVIASSVAAESIATGRLRAGQKRSARPAAGLPAPVAEVVDEPLDATPAGGTLASPDLPTFAESNGEPVRPAEQQRR